ncbi:MAG: XRE family transcriptional regulator [Chryseobacterium sp.]|nr:MAG: XRE family transcriptional regulator [Chryseobacterium sp.]
MKTGSALDNLLNEIPVNDRAKTTERMRLAVRLFDLITEAGYSKSSFAHLMGKEASVITKWLSGTHNFTYDTLVDITLALGVNMIALHEERQPQLLAVKHYKINGAQSPIPEMINWYSVAGYASKPIFKNLNEKLWGIASDSFTSPPIIIIDNLYQGIPVIKGGKQKRTMISTEGKIIEESHE